MVEIDRRLKMDNETPKYANWLPEAGGYVADGKVVSKSPKYNEQGKLKLDVDASLFTPQTSQATSQQNVLSQGTPQANPLGSKEDANAAITQIGSLGSLDQNTQNATNSAISSPATKSSVAGDVVLSPLDKANQDYQNAIARNDLQGAINALTQVSAITGEDYSAKIDELTQKRENKIQSIDDQYISNYKAALAYGDGELADSILREQAAWREGVGYASTMEAKKERELQVSKLQYDYSFMDGANQIANYVMQSVGQLMNFQYDPTQDTALARAEAYTRAKMTEQFANTGMYYSSAVAYAVTKAVGELVPVYEQMAKDEIKDKISTLMSTANFLMNLEQTQFNMWKSQIELQFKEAQEKRAQRDAAIDRANAIGYFTNEDAAILGVEPGTLSPNERDYIRNKIDEAEKDEREFLQDKALLEYKEYLEEKKLIREQQIKNQYSGSGDSGTVEFELGGVKYKMPTSLFMQNEEYFKSIGLNVGTPTDEKTQETITNIMTGDEYDKDKVQDLLTGTGDGSFNTLSPTEQDNVIEKINNEFFTKNIKDLAKGYSGNVSKNGKIDAQIEGAINEYARWLGFTNLDDTSKAIIIADMYDTYYNSVRRAGNYDLTKTDFNDDVESMRKEGIQKSIERMKNSNDTITSTLLYNYYNGLDGSEDFKISEKILTDLTSEPTAETPTETVIPDEQKPLELVGTERVKVKVPSDYDNKADRKEYAKRMGYEYDEKTGDVYKTKKIYK